MIRSVELRSPSGGRVTLAGGILGLASEGPAVGERLRSDAFDLVLLGIPFEDLDAIRATSGKEHATEFHQDTTDDLYLKTLARFGEVRVPPADLYVAFEHAQRTGAKVEAVDLGDEGHTAVWTEHVGVFELIKNNRRLKRMPSEAFRARTPEEFAREWDERLFPTKGLKRVQDEREAWMAKRIAEAATGAARVFVLVPLARWPGVHRRLVETNGYAAQA